MYSNFILAVKKKNVVRKNLFCHYVNPWQPKVFGVKFSLREIRRTFPIKLRNLKLWKMPKLLIFRFPQGWYFLNFNNTKLKRPSKIFFFCFRTASLGDSSGEKNSCHLKCHLPPLFHPQPLNKDRSFYENNRLTTQADSNQIGRVPCASLRWVGGDFASVKCNLSNVQGRNLKDSRFSHETVSHFFSKGQKCRPSVACVPWKSIAGAAFYSDPEYDWSQPSCVNSWGVYIPATFTYGLIDLTIDWTNYISDFFFPVRSGCSLSYLDVLFLFASYTPPLRQPGAQRSVSLSPYSLASLPSSLTMYVTDINNTCFGFETLKDQVAKMLCSWNVGSSSLWPTFCRKTSSEIHP